MAFLRYAACAATLTLCACFRGPDPVSIAETRISVHAVLVANSDSATVQVSRELATQAADWRNGLIEPVTNAVVRLVHGADTIALSAPRECIGSFMASPDGTLRPPAGGCYAGVVPGGVKPGATYSLLVSIPGATPIHASTQVPDVPQIIEPGGAPELFYNRQGGMRPADTVFVRWSSNRIVQRAELRFTTDRADCFATIAEVAERVGQGHVERRSVTGVDTATVAPYSVDCDAVTATRHPGHLLVTVYDDNYSRYLREITRGESLALRSATFGITGALGVFGAAATAAVPVTLVAR